MAHKVWTAETVAFLKDVARQCDLLSVSCTKLFKHAFTIITEISYIHVLLKVFQSDICS